MAKVGVILDGEGVGGRKGRGGGREEREGRRRGKGGVGRVRSKGELSLKPKRPHFHRSTCFRFAISTLFLFQRFFPFFSLFFSFFLFFFLFFFPIIGWWRVAALFFWTRGTLPMSRARGGRGVGYLACVGTFESEMMRWW